jgi:hypothetical protein
VCGRHVSRKSEATGGVVTAVGLVFAVTMASLALSNLASIGQGGTTIGLGLLFDTLIVRSLMTPSIAALLGRWFWWPLGVRSRPADIRPSFPLASQPVPGACMTNRSAQLRDLTSTVVFAPCVVMSATIGATRVRQLGQDLWHLRDPLARFLPRLLVTRRGNSGAGISA